MIDTLKFYQLVPLDDLFDSYCSSGLCLMSMPFYEFVDVYLKAINGRAL